MNDTKPKEHILKKLQELEEAYKENEITENDYIELKKEFNDELTIIDKPLSKETEDKNNKHNDETIRINHESKHHTQQQTEHHREKNENNFWKYASFFLVIYLVISLAVIYNLYTKPESLTNRLDKTTVANNAVTFINANLLKDNNKAKLTSIDDAGDVYLLKLDVSGQNIESYVSKDGKIFFPTGIDTTQKINTNTNQNSNTNRATVSVDDDPSIGPENAKVTIVEFSDFQCPFCARVEPTIRQILKDYDGKIKFVYRDFPLSFHQYGKTAALAADCALEQGKFWEYHNLLYDKQTEWENIGPDKLKQYAKDLSLDSTKFNECLDTQKYASEVEKDSREGQIVGVSGTPAFYINGIEVSGAQPYNAFKEVIDKELAK